MEDSANILLAFRIHDPEAREYIRYRLVEHCGATEVTRSIYEIDTSDWQDGEWEHELAYIEDEIDPRTDYVHIWYIVSGRMVRSTIGGNAS